MHDGMRYGALGEEDAHNWLELLRKLSSLFSHVEDGTEMLFAAAVFVIAKDCKVWANI